MKKLVLALSLVLVCVSCSQAGSLHDPDPFMMVQNLQRIITTSTNTKDIIEAERLIRDVYGPECDRIFWYRSKLALKAVGVVVIGAFVALTAYNFSR